MQFSSVLAALAFSTTAHAIDIRLYDAQSCHYTYVACKAINPNTCCGYSGKANSIYFVYIPTKWNLQLRYYVGGNCAVRDRTEQSGGRTSACVTGRFSGGGYGFINQIPESKKRGASSECQLPNVLGFGNGTEISLEGLSENEIDLMVKDLKQTLS